eukprot:g13697.t1
MVIPLPSIQTPAAPTRCALAARPWLIVCNVCLLGYSFAQFYTHDIIGGFVTALVAFCSAYAHRGGTIDMHCLVVVGMCCLLKGLFTVIVFIDGAVKDNHAPLFATSHNNSKPEEGERKTDGAGGPGEKQQERTSDKIRLGSGGEYGVVEYNIVQGLCLLGTVALFAIAGIAYIVYSKTDEGESGGSSGGTHYGATDGAGGNAAARRGGTSQSGGGSLLGGGSDPFTPFSGAGNRVGNGDDQAPGEEGGTTTTTHIGGRQ